MVVGVCGERAARRGRRAPASGPERLEWAGSQWSTGLAWKEERRRCSHGMVAGGVGRRRGAGCLHAIAFSGFQHLRNSRWWRLGVRGDAVESRGRVHRQPRGPVSFVGTSVSPLFLWGCSRELSLVRSIRWGMRADLGKRRPIHDARGRLS